MTIKFLAHECPPNSKCPTCGALPRPINPDNPMLREIAAAVMKTEQLWALCRKFVDDNKISCPEAVCQNDHVIEHAYDFIAEVAKLIGYFKYPEDKP